MTASKRSSPADPTGANSKTPGPGFGQGAPDAEQLVLSGVGAGDRLAVNGPVPDGARGGEAQCAGPDGLEDDGPHGVDLFGVGWLIAGATLAHDVGPDGAVGDLGADVDCPLTAFERVEVFGEGLPFPVHALAQGGAGDVLDALHEPDQPVVAVGFEPGRSRRRSCP